MPEVLNPGKEELEAMAGRLLPSARVIRVDECMKGRSPFKLVVSNGERWEHVFFHPSELALACQVLASKLRIGVRG